MLKRTLTPQVPCQHWPVINITPPCDPAQILRPSPRPPWVHDQPGITPRSSHSSSVMKLSASLLAALALTSGAALNLSTATSADAMTIAWDCFDRTSNALVARSAVDLTSPAISCLQAAGAGSTQVQNEPTEQPSDLATDDITGDSSDPGASEFGDEFANDFTADTGAVDPGLAEDLSFQDDTSAGSAFANAGSSTGDALGQAVGNHLGKLLGQGISDLFGRR